jgi:hypothetical protein
LFPDIKVVLDNKIKNQTKDTKKIIEDLCKRKRAGEKN